MCTPLFAIAAGAISAYGQYQAGKANQAIANYNATAQRNAALSARQAGEVEAQQKARETRALIGAQRAEMGASGVALDSGTPLAIQTGTAAVGAQDIAQIRQNAAMQSWGLLTQAQGTEFGGALARMQGNYGAASSLLSGASSYYTAGYKQGPGGTFKWA